MITGTCCFHICVCDHSLSQGEVRCVYARDRGLLPAEGGDPLLLLLLPPTVVGERDCTLLPLLLLLLGESAANILGGVRTRRGCQAE